MKVRVNTGERVRFDGKLRVEGDEFECTATVGEGLLARSVVTRVSDPDSNVKPPASSPNPNGGKSRNK